MPPACHVPRLRRPTRNTHAGCAMSAPHAISQSDRRAPAIAGQQRARSTHSLSFRATPETQSVVRGPTRNPGATLTTLETALLGRVPREGGDPVSVRSVDEQPERADARCPDPRLRGRCGLREPATFRSADSTHRIFDAISKISTACADQAGRFCIPQSYTPPPRRMMHTSTSQEGS